MRNMWELKIIEKQLLLQLILIFVAFSIPAWAGEKENVLQKCEALFGKPVDEKMAISEVKKDFVLKPEFVKDKLVNLSVVPKYWFEEKGHEEWAEPDQLPLILPAGLKQLEERLETIKPLGALVYAPSFCAVTNMTCWKTSFHENSTLETGWSGSVGTRFLKINFFAETSGEVIKKIKVKHDKTAAYYEIGVSQTDQDGDEARKVYYVKKETYDAVREGKTETFEGIFVGRYFSKEEQKNMFKRF